MSDNACQGCGQIHYTATKPRHCTNPKCPWWACGRCGSINDGKGHHFPKAGRS